jgi:uncharacterized protein YkwD
MKKVLTLIFVFLLSVQAFSQSTQDVIDPAKFNQKLLEQMVQFKVNEYRKSKGLRPMLLNEKLYLAAKDQSDYIRTKNQLTHDQAVKGKETVADRLRFYTKSSNFSVAENIARTYVLIPAYNYDSNGKTSTKKQLHICLIRGSNHLFIMEICFLPIFQVLLFVFILTQETIA